MPNFPVLALTYLKVIFLIDDARREYGPGTVWDLKEGWQGISRDTRRENRDAYTQMQNGLLTYRGGPDPGRNGQVYVEHALENIPGNFKLTTKFRIDEPSSPIYDDFDLFTSETFITLGTAPRPTTTENTIFLSDSTLGFHPGPEFALQEDQWYNLELIKRGETSPSSVTFQSRAIGSPQKSVDWIAIDEAPVGTNSLELRIWADGGSRPEVPQVTNQTPAPPPRPALPSFDGFNPISKPFGNARNAIVLVHGFDDSTDLFQDDLNLDDPGTTNMEQNLEQFLVDSQLDEDYDVIVYDWEEHAALAGPIPFIPLSSHKRNALVHGNFLASQLVSNGYDGHIHFIAHSLGGRVIHSAAFNLRENDNWNGTIHETFLDAYTPDDWEYIYGYGAEFAEHIYHDDGPAPLLLNTEDDFPNALNVDITELNDNLGLNLLHDHKWPVRWYNSTISNPGSSPLGFSLSREAGADWPVSELIGEKVVFTDERTVQRGGLVTAVLNTLLHSVDSSVINVSPEGTVLVDILEATLTTGSPVWFNMELDIAAPTNFLEFNYEFLSDSDGVLSVYLNGELLTLLYEEFSADNEVSTDALLFEDVLQPGEHILSFRLDTNSALPSSVSVGDVQTGFVTVVPEPSNLLLCIIGLVPLILLYPR